MKFRKYLLNAGLVLAFSVIGLVLVEVGARLLFGAPVQTRGTLFFSDNTFANGDASAVRFSPDSSIRAISQFGDYTEFDVRFKTNNKGLVDSRAYPLAAVTPPVRNIAIVGDSFTAGYHGGIPWVPDLQQRLSGANIYNLGVTGTGFEQFDQLQGELADDLNISETLIVAISSDVVRKSWRPVKQQNRLYFCSRDTATADCLKRKSSVFLLRGDESENDIRAIAQQNAQDTRKPGLKRYLSRHTYVGRLFHARTWKKRTKKLDTVAVADFSIAALQRMHNRLGPTLTLLQIPERREVETNGYSADLKSVAGSIGIRFVNGLTECGLTYGDYYDLDSHPNASGYAKIQTCVARVLTHG